MKTIKFDEIDQGTELPEITAGTITHAALVRYAGASGDFNPIHNDPAAARNYGLDGTIAHGMLSMAWLGKLCTSWTDKRNIRSFSVKFKGMAKPGQTIKCRGKVKRKKEDGGQKLATVSLEAFDESEDIKATGEIIVICE